MATTMNNRDYLRHLAPPVLIAALALMLYLVTGENGWVRVLWAASIVWLLVGFTSRWSWPAWTSADGRDMVLLAIITGVGFGLRFWRLSQIPDYFHGDIASQGLQALDILHHVAPGWFATGWSNIPMFDYVMMAGTMRLFGTDLFGLSMTAVWQGTLTIPLLYLLGRELRGRSVGLLAAAFLAINYTHIHFSRIVTTASPVLFMVAMFYVLFRARRVQTLGGYALAGVLLGVGLLLYFPVRVSVVIVVLLFLFLLLWRRRQTLDEWQSWLLFAVGSLLGFGPMFGFVFQNFSAFVGRGNVVTLANPQVMAHLQAKYGVSSAAAVWLEQFKRTFLTFFSYGDSSTHFSFPGPMVSTLVGVLLVVGVVIALRRWRDEGNFTLLVWVLATLVLGGVITNDPPFWPHLVVVLPAVMLLAAQGAVGSWQRLRSYFPAEIRPRADKVAALLLSVAILFTGVHNWQSYLRLTEHNADTIVSMARYVASLPAGTRVLLVSEPYHAQERELQFMGQKLLLTEIDADALQAGKLETPARPTVILLTSNHRSLVPLLQKKWPQASVRQHHDGRGHPSFVSISLPLTTTPLPSDTTNPALSLARRSRIGWLLAILLLGSVSLVGGWRWWRRDTGPLEEIISKESPPTLPVSPTVSSPAAVPTSSFSADAVAPIPKPLLALAGVVLAVLLAYIAQHFYDGTTSGMLVQLLSRLLPRSLAENALLAGTLLYGVAMALFAWLAPGLPRLERPLSRPHRPAYPGRRPPDARIVRADRPLAPTITAPDRFHISPRWQRHWQWLAAALIPYAASMVLFALRGEDALVRALWAVGIILFLFGQALWPWWQHEAGAEGEYSPRFGRVQVFLLLIVLAVGFWLRFNQLQWIPHDFHGDMASHGLQARDILAGRTHYWFHEGWANIPMLAFMPAALSLKIFGNTLFGLRMASVIGGTFVLFSLYLLTWRLFDRHRPALLATAVLAINTPHIHFSRIAEYMDPWPFLVTAMFFLVDGLKARRPASFAIAGILLGLGVQMYYSSRVIVFILLFSVVYLFLCHRPWIKENGRSLLLLIAGGLIAMGPSLIYFATHSEAFLERSRSVFLFYDPVMTHLFGKYGLSSQWAVLGEQIKRSLLMFNHSIDSSTQFGYPHPMFASILSPWLVLGVGYSVRHWRKPGPGLTLIWLTTIMIMGSILTNNAPFWPRLVGILPAAALLIGLALDRTLLLIEKGLALRGQGVNLAMSLVALLVIAYAGYANWQLYSHTVAFNARGQARVGRYIEKLPLDMAICNFSDPFQLSVRETYFLAWPRKLLDLPADVPDGVLKRCPGPPLVWILTPNHMDRLPALQALWPDGILEEHYYGSGTLAFSSYMVATTPVRETQPLTTTPTPVVTPAATAVVNEAFTAYMPDGSTFTPQKVFLGNTSSSPWQIDAGEVEVRGGTLTLFIGPIPGHDAVFDSIKLVAANGRSYLFEAEDPNITEGDTFATREGVDGHWWLQNYEPFSQGQGLVAQKQETVPVLKSTVTVPDGRYHLIIGSFTGDPDNGVFGLGLIWKTGS